MFTCDGLRLFHTWTHSCLDVVLDHLSTMSTSDLVRDVPGFGFPTLREQSIHIFNCEGFWIHTLRGQEYINRLPEEFSIADDVRLFQREVKASTTSYLLDLTDQQINASAELRFADGDVAVRTPALVLHHVLTHAFHHKGQMVAMCRVLGHPAPGSDLSQIE